LIKNHFRHHAVVLNARSHAREGRVPMPPRYGTRKKPLVWVNTNNEPPRGYWRIWALFLEATEEAHEHERWVAQRRKEGRARKRLEKFRYIQGERHSLYDFKYRKKGN